MKLTDLVAGLDRYGLIDATNAMIDTMLSLTHDIIDADVIYVPDDPDAEDPYAEDETNLSLAWTLGHVIAHTTASGEETCAQAATLARGVEVLGRNRYEKPWQLMRTASDVRHRLEESRRIRLAYLNAWPDEPHYEITFTPYRSPQNCVERVAAGLFHDDSHLEQIAEIVRQAKAARQPS
ncbi:MAG: DinB family protein [Caldilineales bacterium]|nr:DinB family protein [Caldilineales bacterium]